MLKEYVVRLTDEERMACEATGKNHKGKSDKLRAGTDPPQGRSGRSWLER